MAKRKDQNSLNVGRNVDNSIIQVGDNPTTNIHNNLDGEKVGQSLGETLNDAAWRDSFWEMRRESDREDSRQVMETIFVSLVSGFAIAACWELTSPFNVESSMFFVISTIVFFNVMRITSFGLRHTIAKIGLISMAYVLLLKFTPIAQNWIDVSWFVRGISLSLIGAIIGLIAGIYQLLFHPLED